MASYLKKEAHLIEIQTNTFSRKIDARTLAWAKTNHEDACVALNSKLQACRVKFKGKLWKVIGDIDSSKIQSEIITLQKIVKSQRSYIQYMPLLFLTTILMISIIIYNL